MFETKTITINCRDCGTSVSTPCLFFLGEPKIAPTVCDTCADKLEQHQRDREQQQREHSVESRRRDHEARWTALAPVEFRIRSETGGHTQVERMDEAQPDWRRLLDWIYGARGLLIRGSTGKCKTRATWRLLRRLFDGGHRIVALTAAQFDRQCRDAGGNFTLSQWFDRLARADILFIDDLGKAQWTPATEVQFFDLVDERTRTGLPIIVTTNDSGESLSARLSDDRAEPLVRRLRDYCECVTFE